jgi:predicted component of type VI protein secretion system
VALLALAFGACSKPETPAPSQPAAAQPSAATPAQNASAGGLATPQPITQTAAPSTPPPPLANPLAAGSQGAKDDLYCSAVIFATYAPRGEALSPTEEAVRMRNEGMGMVIAQAGADKLMAEGVARVTQLGAIADAYSDQVSKDTKANKIRLNLDACMKRAEALPKPQ